jgi:hypothetical protein
MSYAYYQGQEAEALDYYRRLLERTANPEDRSKIEKVIQELAAIVGDVKQPANVGAVVVHNAYFA